MTGTPTQEPLVSAVIAAYNCADTIADAIASIQAQTYPNIEIVICNDGSTDDTAAVVREICPEAIYIEQENAGPAAARNAAAAAASGEFLAPLDADDRWAPEKIERQLAVFDERPEIGAVATNGIVVTGERRQLWQSARGPRLRELSVADLLQGDRNPILASMLMRTEVFRELGGYDEGIVCGEDLDLFCRMVAAGYPLVALREPLYIYLRAEQTVTGKGVIERERDMLRVMEKMDPRVEHEGYRSPLTPREFSALYGERLLRLVWAHQRRGDYEQVHRLLARVDDLPAPAPTLRLLARLEQCNRRLFAGLLTIERRLRHTRYFIARWGLWGPVQRYQERRAGGRRS